MLAYLCRYYLPALDSNDTECTEEGEDFEYQEEEDQGQADQGKSSILVAYLILVLLIACFINVYELALFILLLPVDSNYWRLGSTSQLLPSLWMAPSLDTYLSPGLVA
jgi:hypothetical protein